LRKDFDGPGLQRLAKLSKDAGQSRRLLAMAEICDVDRRTDAARIADVQLQFIQDRVLRFNSAEPSGLINRKAWIKLPRLNNGQRKELSQIIGDEPIPEIHALARWRLVDLCQWVWQEFGISRDEGSVGRILRALGFTRITARLRHPGQNELMLSAFKILPHRSRSDPPNPPHRHQGKTMVAG